MKKNVKGQWVPKQMTGMQRILGYCMLIAYPSLEQKKDAISQMD